MTRAVALGLAAIALASTLGYWGIGAYQQGRLQKTVTALVQDSSDRLGAAIALETEVASANAAQTVGKLDEQVQEVDRHVIELRDLSPSLNRVLIGAAEDYLLTVRQILREQAASHRYRVQVAASDEALREHMRAANRRSVAWIDEAIRAKDRMEKDYFDYRVSVQALERLLASYPSARKKVASQIRIRLLADEDIANARQRALATSKHVAEDVERARQLAAVH